MLRRKLLARVGLLVCGFVVGAVVAIWLLQDALESIDHLNMDTTVLIDGTQQISAAVTVIEAAEYDQELGRPLEPATVEAAKQTIGESIQALDAHAFTQAEGTPGAAAFVRMRGLVAEFLSRSAGDSTPDAAGVRVELRRAILGLATTAREHVSAERVHLGRYFRALVIGLTLAALVTLNVAIFVLLRIAQMILRPVGELVLASRELAAERFEHRVQIDQDDEFGELAHAYNRLAGELAANEGRKMDTLRQLGVTLNHDLNNAIAIIELQLGLLDRRSGGNPTLRDHLGQIRASLARMTDTVASLKHIRRVVLTDYVPGQKMVDLARSVADDPFPEAPDAAPAGGPGPPPTVSP